MKGAFFPPAKAILHSEVLDVNKIHFVLACNPNVAELINDIFNYLNYYRGQFALRSNDYYFLKLATPNRFDSKEIIFIKRLLQFELDLEIRSIIVDKLFRKYVTDDEKDFSNSLYMNLDQIKYLVECGMYIGSHGYNHVWLDRVSRKEQEYEIEKSIEFLKIVNAPINNWVMCYPYGGYNKSLIDVITKKKCKLALTTNHGLAQLNRNNAFTLERFDTNDFPKTLK